MVLIVAVVGESGSGKTVTIEFLINQFSVENYKVGVIKHIHHKGFTIDTEGKNTWRYAQAGAKIIAAISPNEVAIIKKTVQDQGNLDLVIDAMVKEDLDVIFVEGYHELMAKKVDITKIIVSKKYDDVLQKALCSTVGPIIAISGLVAKNSNVPTIQGYPVIKIPKDGKKLVELIKQHIASQKKSGD
jgi:molybdopterin-guanine dinucleotide biosynthesis protein B